jgi:hypothetical protein
MVHPVLSACLQIPAKSIGASQARLPMQATRSRQSNFGALSGGLIERGNVPADVLYGSEAPEADAPAPKLSPAQIERLLRPQPAPPAPVILPIVKHEVPADQTGAAPIPDVRRKSSAPMLAAICAVTLFNAAISGWVVLRTATPSAMPAADATRAPIAENPVVVAAKAPPVDTVPEVVLPSAAEAPPVIETAAIEEPATEVVVTRTRPGATRDEPAPVAVAPVLASVSSEEAAELTRRGDDYLRHGDIVTARLFYERAAASGDPQAMMALAQSYDAGVLRKLGARGIHAEAKQAEHWYTRAAEAQRRTAQR